MALPTSRTATSRVLQRLLGQQFYRSNSSLQKRATEALKSGNNTANRVPAAAHTKIGPNASSNAAKQHGQNKTDAKVNPLKTTDKNSSKALGGDMKTKSEPKQPQVSQPVPPPHVNLHEFAPRICVRFCFVMPSQPINFQ